MNANSASKITKPTFFTADVILKMQSIILKVFVVNNWPLLYSMILFTDAKLGLFYECVGYLFLYLGWKCAFIVKKQQVLPLFG